MLFIHGLISCSVPTFCVRSSAYSVATILIQLQSFLFEENAIPQDYGGYKKNFPNSKIVAVARKCAAAFKCPGCSHGSPVESIGFCPSTTTRVWPPLPPPQRCPVAKSDSKSEEDAGKKKTKPFVLSDHMWPTLGHCPAAKSVAKSEQDTGTREEIINGDAMCGQHTTAATTTTTSTGTLHLIPRRRAPFSLSNLEDFLWLHVCSYITVQDTHRLRQVCRHAARVHYKYNIVRRREMICFHR